MKNDDRTGDRRLTTGEDYTFTIWLKWIEFLLFIVEMGNKRDIYDGA